MPGCTYLLPLLAVTASTVALTACGGAEPSVQYSSPEGASPVSTETSTTPTLDPRIVGQAENAHRAVLNRELSGTGVDYPQWVTLVLTCATDAPIQRRQLVERAADSLKNQGAADKAVRGLIESALIAPDHDKPESVVPTEAGRALAGHVRAATNAVITRAYASVSRQDLTTAATVLTTVTAQLNQELAGS